MYTTTRLAIVVIILFLCSAGCSEERLTQSKLVSFVDIQIKEEGWSSKPYYQTIVNYYTLTVAEGDEFFKSEGPPIKIEGNLFSVVEIKSKELVEIAFQEILVVVGEPISKPSGVSSVDITPLGITFRTRSCDAGKDFTLKIVKIKHRD